MLNQLNLDGRNRVEESIYLIQKYEPPEGYFLAFSGGKDSTVIYDLTKKSGVKFTAHYSVTGVDPPELVQHIRKYYPDVIWLKPKETMWRLVEKKGFPLRKARWCCRLLKEGHGEGLIITGIRSEESARRASRGIYNKGRKKGKDFLHPIIDWHEGDVWEYIEQNNLPYCKLYDEGFSRLGCVLCPMATTKQTQRELQRWPKLADAWKRAGQRFWDARPDLHKHPDYESYWQWWFGRSRYEWKKT